MKMEKIVLCMTLISCALPIFGKKDKDATQEVNKIEQKESQQEKDDAVQEVVLTTFAKIVQNFANIVQDPHDSSNVGSNITQMLAGILNAGMTIMRNLPEEVTLEERQELVEELQEALTRHLRSLAIAKKAIARSHLQ